jgi:hypothetical protein
LSQNIDLKSFLKDQILDSLHKFLRMMYSKMLLLMKTNQKHKLLALRTQKLYNKTLMCREHMCNLLMLGMFLQDRYELDRELDRIRGDLDMLGMYPFQLKRSFQLCRL